MLELLKEKPCFVIEAEKACFRPRVIVQVLIFALVFIVTQIAASLPVVIVTFVKTITDITGGRADLANPANSQAYANELMNSNFMSLLTLFCTAIATALAIIYCKFIEKRSLYSMGFTRKKAGTNYFSGLLIGALMFGGSVLLCWVTGALEFKGVVMSGGIVIIALFFLGFLLQGMSEEVILRGYFMVSVAAKKTVLMGVLLNSILFACLHLANQGISYLPIINLVLFGVFASLYMLRTGNIWGVAAIHSMWNFVQGNVFGIAVSGKNIDATVFSFASIEGKNLINGGNFGLEGGLAVTAVLVISIVVTVFWKGNLKIAESKNGLSNEE